MFIAAPVRSLGLGFMYQNSFLGSHFFDVFLLFFNSYDQICSFLFLTLHICDFKKSVLRITFKETNKKTKLQSERGKKKTNPLLVILLNALITYHSKSLMGGVKVGIIRLYLSIPKSKHEAELQTGLDYGNYETVASTHGFNSF